MDRTGQARRAREGARLEDLVGTSDAAQRNELHVDRASGAEARPAGDIEQGVGPGR